MIVTIINGGQCLPRGLSCALAARDFHQLISRELAVVVVDRARVVVGGGVVRGCGGCAPRPREREKKKTESLLLLLVSAMGGGSGATRTLRKGFGGKPCRSVVRHAARSAASSGHASGAGALD